MTVTVELDVESAAALHAIAEAYAAGEDMMGTPFGRALDESIQPLRDVITRDQAAEATEALRTFWGSP